MGVSNHIRWASRPGPEVISESAAMAVRTACHEVHAFRKNAGPRDLFAILLLSAQMEGWDFEEELREGRAIASRPDLTEELPVASKRGAPGDFIKNLVEDAKVSRDVDKIKKLISRMPGGFNRFVLMHILKEIEED